MSWKPRVERYLLITPELLSKAMPRASSEWAFALDRAIEKWGTRNVPAFLAQVGHESADLSRLEESLSYTAPRLMAVWPTRFRTLEAAKLYERNPPALANNVYGGRMGNSQPGDGWKYRGRGLIQLTGRENYQRCADATGVDCINNPDVLLTKEGASESACWYWHDRVNPDASFETITRQINGGTHGLQDRANRYEMALRAFRDMGVTVQ